MRFFDSPHFDHHERLVFGTDPATGLRAIIAVHSTRLGPGLGGTRMWAYGSEDDAIADVLRLSRGMTYKNALAGLPFGGGKGIIIGDPKRDKTPELMRAYGRLVDDLGGLYITAEDVGTTVGDLDLVRLETCHARGLSDSTGNPSPATAYGVFCGLKAACAFAFGSEDMTDRHVAVQGLGNVGSRLCSYLHNAGARLTVTDIDPGRVDRARQEFGADAVAPEAIFDVDADVFAPCALGAVINDQTVDRLRTPVIAGAANNQLAEPRHGWELMKRKIVYAPDYVGNAGGVMDVAFEDMGLSRDELLHRVDKIGMRVGDILRRAARETRPPGEVADAMAEEILARAGNEDAAA